MAPYANMWFASRPSWPASHRTKHFFAICLKLYLDENLEPWLPATSTNNYRIAAQACTI